MARNSLVRTLNLEIPVLEPLSYQKPKDVRGFAELKNFSWPEASLKIEFALNQYFEKIPFWQESRALFLGSLGRHEICPNSDLDLLFLGPEAAVIAVMKSLQEAGLKVRSRIPKDLKDWSQGVESFDLLSLMAARAANPKDQNELSQQIDCIQSSKKLKEKIKSDLVLDRKRRRIQFDSMADLLEPQLKIGPGGLREIQQAQDLMRLFSEKFNDAQSAKAFRVFSLVKNLLLQVRFELHLMGLDDHLVASAQLDLTQKYKLERVQDLMREISRALSRSYFYVDWVFERLSASRARLQNIEKLKFRKAADAIRLLEKDPSVLVQAKIRMEMDDVCKKEIPSKIRGKLLQKAIAYNAKPQLTEALFRSRFFDFLCPEVRRLVGWVQHDQYHRWTAEAHLLKVIQEVQAVYQSSKRVLALSPVAKLMKRSDWNILAWTALYHDLAKASSGDHSELGQKWVRADFQAFGFTKSFSDEVGFLVEHHLVLSTLSFRRNAQDEKTWKEIWQLGFTEERIRRLVVFTAIDIRGTNVEAYNQWKSELLLRSMNQLISPEKQRFVQSRKILKAKKLNLDFFDAFDPEVFMSFSGKTLQNDLLRIRKRHGEDLVLLRDLKKKIWIRFYHPKDQEGQFQRYVQTLFEAGCRVDQAFVQTLPGLGVYDLFQIQNRKIESEAKFLKRLVAILSSLELQGASLPRSLKFEKIELVDAGQERSVLSFRGIDQRGILLGLAKALREESLSVLKAQIHTWGRQIEDVITVKSDQDLENKIKNLKQKLLGV